MRKILLVVLALAAIQNWDQITGFFDASREIVSYSGEQVVMYSTQWCGYCAKARRLFRSNNVPYVEHDIEKSLEARAQYDALGGRGVPLMIINGNLISGYSRQRILAALHDTRMP